MEYKHTFNTIQEAEDAINLINKGEGIPRFPDSMTTTYCTYYEEDGKYYIDSDEVTVKYLNLENEE
jgi:hypothetical protein